MKFVADENLEQQIVDLLRLNNYEVIFIAESHPGFGDEDILQVAEKNKAVLITNDKDFGELIFRKKKSCNGIVFLRLEGLSNNEKAIITLNCINKYKNELPNSYIVIAKEAIRIRKLN